MSLAPVAYLLFQNVLVDDPADVKGATSRSGRSGERAGRWQGVRRLHGCGLTRPGPWCAAG